MPPSGPPRPAALALHHALPISFHHRRTQRGHRRGLGHPALLVGHRQYPGLSHKRRSSSSPHRRRRRGGAALITKTRVLAVANQKRSEEHTSELQSRVDLVCRLLARPAPPPLPSTTLFRSLSPSAAPSEATVVVLATPPFWFATANTRVLVISAAPPHRRIVAGAEEERRL